MLVLLHDVSYSVSINCGRDDVDVKGDVKCFGLFREESRIDVESVRQLTNPVHLHVCGCVSFRRNICHTSISVRKWLSFV